MPIQKKKKKPKAKKEKTPAVSQKVTQIVRVNVGDVKPKPRRRRAPAKKPAQPFGFGGGGGGGSGLVQQVQAPQVTQDVLQQSKELREIVNKLQTSPAQQTLLGSERGGQQERAIMPDEQPVTRGQFTNIMGQFIGHQGEQMTLAGERLEAVRQAVHALAQPTQEAEVPITELHDPAQNPSSTLVEPAVSTPMRMGRGKARTSEQNQSDLDKWAASGLSQKDFAQQQGISYNTLATIARPHGGINAYRTSKGLSTKKKKRGKASESSDSGEETDFP